MKNFLLNILLRTSWKLIFDTSLGDKILMMESVGAEASCIYCYFDIVNILCTSLVSKLNMF